MSIVQIGNVFNLLTVYIFTLLKMWKWFKIWKKFNWSKMHQNYSSLKSNCWVIHYAYSWLHALKSFWFVGFRLIPHDMRKKNHKRTHHWYTHLFTTSAQNKDQLAEYWSFEKKNEQLCRRNKWTHQKIVQFSARRIFFVVVWKGNLCFKRFSG